MPPLPTLRTDRLVLRAFEDRDAPEIVALDGDPEVMRYLGGVPETSTVDAALGMFERLRGYPQGTGLWAAEYEDRFIGWFHLRAARDETKEMELGYRLRKDAWGRGLATEGSLELLRHGWETLGVPSIMASTDPENIGSRRVMGKVGMVYAEDFLYEGVHPSVRYRILRPRDLRLRP